MSLSENNNTIEFDARHKDAWSDFIPVAKVALTRARSCYQMDMG